MNPGRRRKVGHSVSRMSEEIAASICLMWWRRLARAAPALEVFEAWRIDICRRPRDQTHCGYTLTSHAGHKLRLEVEGAGATTDSRLLGELLFYSYCSDDVAKMYGDESIFGNPDLPTAVAAYALSQKI